MDETPISEDTENAQTKNSLLMSWSGISCTYEAKRRGQVDATTLHNSAGELRTGELTAIMGPSGSGKTTLMDILSGRKRIGTVTGIIKMFGEIASSMNEASKLLRDVTAYVPQDVAFLPMQTPEEAVLFVANLKHGRDGMSLTEVHQILDDVGLGESGLYKRPIGGALAGGMDVRGISGGEKKRLAVACALAMKPQLMMLDEITSGLDSENALATMELIKQVCISRDVSAAVIIHQPDGYVFETFNRLILLHHGECIFSNDVSRIKELYRRRFRAPMPSSMHEIPLDLLRRIKDPIECGSAPLEEAVLEEDQDSGSIECGFAPLEKDQDSGSIECGVASLEEDQESGSVWTATKQVRAIHVPFHWQLATVFHRNLLNHYVRNVTNVPARLLCYTACSLLDGAIFFRVGENQSNSVIGAFTFIILISYLLPFATIPIFVHDKKFFLCERGLGLYSPWVYCISQTLLETWVVVLAAIIEAAIVIPMCSLWNPEMPHWQSFFTLLSALIASGLTGSAVVLFFSVFMPSQDLAFLVGSAFVTLSLGLSGGFVPFTAIEDFISWLQWISPCKYSLQALAVGYYQGTDGMAIVEHAGLDRPSGVTANIGVLFAMFAAWAVATMLVLKRQREIR